MPEVDASPSEVPTPNEGGSYGGGEEVPVPDASSAAPDVPASSAAPEVPAPTEGGSYGGDGGYGGGEEVPVPDASSAAPDVPASSAAPEVPASSAAPEVPASSAAPEVPAPTEGGSYGGDGGYGGGEEVPVPDASSAVPDASSAPAEPSASEAPVESENPQYGGTPTGSEAVPSASGDVDVSSSALAPSASASGEIEQPSASASASGEIEQPSASASGEIEQPSASASASGEIEQPSASASASASASGEIEQPSASASASASASGDEELPVSSGTPVSSGEASSITSAPVSSAPTYEEMITTEITTSYVYECPTGLVTVPTIVTELPAASASASGDVLPGWNVVTRTCENGPSSGEVITQTLPPNVAPTGPTDGPLISEVASATAPSSADASVTEAPVSSAPAEEEMVTTLITTSYVYECPTGLVTVPTVVTEVPVATGSASASDVIPGWQVVTRTCENGPSSGEVITQTLPPNVAPTGPTDGPITSAVPSATAPSSADASVTEAPVSSAPAEEEMVTTLITTSYVYECPTGLVTVPTVVTEVPVATGSASVSDVIPGWQVVTRTCENGPSSGEVITQTLPPNVAPTGPIEGPSITSVESSKPTEVPATPTDEPVVDVPVATPGEEVVTTVIKTTYTNICPTGLEETTAEVTKTIPASATSVPVTISMTEVVTVCTVCAETPTEVTLTVPATTPAAVETTAAAVETTPAAGESTAPAPEITSPPVYTISSIPEDAETIAYTISTPNQPPVIVEGVASKPVAASSAESIPCVTVTEVKGLTPEVPQTTDVVEATYDVIGPSGVATTTSKMTMTHPAADTVVPAVEYTTTVTECANCGPDGGAQTVTLNVPMITSTFTITPTYFQTIPVATGSGVPVPAANSTGEYVKPEAPLYTGAATRLGASVMAIAGVMAAAFVL